MTIMEIHSRNINDVTVVSLEGELDAYWSDEARRQLADLLNQGHSRLVVDLGGLTYLSSAGLRVLLELHRRISALGGQVVLANPHPYVRNVLTSSGFDRALPVCDTTDEAVGRMACASKPTRPIASVESAVTPIGSFAYQRAAHPPAQQVGWRIVGQADDCLYSRATVERLTTLNLGEMGYALGVGALAESKSVALTRLGELVAVPGAVYWLPGDGRQTPDFMTVATNGSALPVYVLCGACVLGTPSLVGRFTASDAEEGAALSDITRELRSWAARQPGYCGLTGLVLRADIAWLWGIGLKRSPQAGRAPANGHRINHRENIRDWLHFPTEPACRNHTLIGSGVLADWTSPKLPIERARAIFGATEPDRPAPPGSHVHAAVFEAVPELGGDAGLEAELAHVSQAGSLVGVSHVMPTTRLRKAIFGMWTITV